jgi:hypothetical protein
MLRNLSQDVRGRYAHADDCARRAECAFGDGVRRDCLGLERSWLTLARSYEFAERLGRNQSEAQFERRNVIPPSGHETGWEAAMAFCSSNCEQQA